MSSELNKINWMCYPKKKAENFTNVTQNNNIETGYDIFKKYMNSTNFNFDTVQTKEGFNNTENGDVETNYEIMGMQKPVNNLTLNIDSTKPVETNYEIMGMNQNVEGFSNTSSNLEAMKMNLTNNNYTIENPFSDQMNVTIPTSAILNNN